MVKRTMDNGHANIYSSRYEDAKNPFVGFCKMILVWHGSIFKLIWTHLIVFALAFSGISLVYRNILIHDEEQRKTFELVCHYCQKYSEKIPVNFTTAFYVANVVSRYWDQFISLPWPDRLAYKLITYIPGRDEYSRMLRRTVVRYANLSTVLVFRLVSKKVRDRFPTYKSLVEAGLMLPGEDTRLEEIDAKTNHETTWAPAMWAVTLLQQERSAGRYKPEPAVYVNVINAFEYLEISNRRILNHGWVNFPFAYTQIITLSVYSYLYSHLFGRQFLEPKEENGLPPGDEFTLLTTVTYIPVFTVIEFIAYLGWIKVAETLLNPWGEDDEDFQVNYVIDRNFQTSLLIVDEAMSEIPLLPDVFMSTSVPSQLPYYNKKKPKTVRRQKLMSCGLASKLKQKGKTSSERQRSVDENDNQSTSNQKTSNSVDENFLA